MIELGIDPNVPVYSPLERGKTTSAGYVGRGPGEGPGGEAPKTGLSLGPGSVPCPLFQVWAGLLSTRNWAPALCSQVSGCVFQVSESSLYYPEPAWWLFLSPSPSPAPCPTPPGLCSPIFLPNLPRSCPGFRFRWGALLGLGTLELPSHRDRHQACRQCTYLGPRRPQSLQ